MRAETPARPLQRYVAALWNASLPVGSDADSTAWFAYRYGSAAIWFIQQTELWNLARVIPVDTRLPRWFCSQGGPWAHTGHRIIVRLWDNTGQAVSLRARSVIATEAPKSQAPSGCSVKGLVFADPLGCQFHGAAKPGELFGIDEVLPRPGSGICPRSNASC